MNFWKKAKINIRNSEKENSEVQSTVLIQEHRGNTYYTARRASLVAVRTNCTSIPALSLFVPNGGFVKTVLQKDISYV